VRTVTWTPAKLKVFKAAYDAAIAKPHKTSDVITVELPDEAEPAQFVIDYARHLIDYLETEFARNPPRDYGENKEGEEGQ